MSQFAFILGESFNGVVARWADEVGGVERMIDLTGAAGVRYGHRQQAATTDEADIRALAAEMQVDADELLARATPYVAGDYTNHRHPLRFGHVTVPSLLVEKRVRRFSPAGLAGSPHHRALWDVRLLPACVETGEILLDGCGDPECGLTAWSATLGIDMCEHCMTGLSSLRADRIPDGTRATLAEFAGLFSHDRGARDETLSRLPPAVADLGGGDVVDLLVRLVPMIDNRLPTDLRALLGADPAALSEAVAAAWKALTGWPDAVGAIAAVRVASRTGRHNDGNEGRTMRFLSRRLQFGASVQVASLIATWRRSLSVDKPEGAELRGRTATGTDVAIVTGLETTKVVEYRRAGVFGIQFALDLDRPEARFDRVELDGIRDALADRVSVERARNVLGLPCHGVEQLAAMHLLISIAHPYFEVHYGGPQISKASLTELLAAIHVSAARCRSDTLPLRAAMKTVGGRLKPWGEAFRMLVAGELRFAMAPGDMPLTDAILIDPSIIPLVRSLVVAERIVPAISPMMSKADAGEMLNLAPVKATELLAHIETGVGSHRKAVPLDLVQRLARRHMPVAEMAARRGVSPLRAHLDAISAMVPHLGTGGFCRASAEAKLFGAEAAGPGRRPRQTANPNT